MDITGARWGLDGAEAILKLRAITSNGDFDAYWTFCQQQEQLRVHNVRYWTKRPVASRCSVSTPNISRSGTHPRPTTE